MAAIIHHIDMLNALADEEILLEELANRHDLEEYARALAEESDLRAYPGAF